MGEKLLSPPLIEALCEFRFKATGAWDWTLPGRLYERIGKEFTERSEVDAVEVGQVHSEPGKLPFPITKRFQMKRSDGSAMVQTGPDFLAVNCMRLYPGWETFLALILRIFEEYMVLRGKCDLERIGLRYINQILPPGEKYQLESLITVAPQLKGSLDRPLAGFYQRYEILLDSPKGILIHQTGIQTKDGAAMLMLDLDCGSRELEGVCDRLAVEKWLIGAHDLLYECFVGSLNPDLYDGFKKGIK